MHSQQHLPHLSISVQLCGPCVSVLRSWGFESPSALCPATSFLSPLPPMPRPCTVFSIPLGWISHQLHPPQLSGHQPLPGIFVPLLAQSTHIYTALLLYKSTSEYISLFDFPSHLEKKVRYYYPLLAKEGRKSRGQISDLELETNENAVASSWPPGHVGCLERGPVSWLKA